MGAWRGLAPIHLANAATLALIRLANAAAQLPLRGQARRKESYCFAVRRDARRSPATTFLSPHERRQTTIYFFSLLAAVAAASACFFTSKGTCCSQKRKVRPPGKS